jgi:flagellar basal-body rod protein FlgG
MDLGLYIAAQGMLAEQVRQDKFANDLANGSTPGYEPDEAVQSSFGSMLLSNTSTGQVVGSIDSGVKVTKIVTSNAPLPLDPTGNALDFAIAGQGFFAVRTASGVQYTRNGQFSANSQGLLVDQFGDQVLSQTGSPIQVGAKGTVPASAVGVFDVPNARKLGDNNFSGTPAGRGTGTVEAGQLDGSGVDPIETITGMTASLQAYQAGQKAITTIGQTMQESASQIALIPGAA